MTLSSLLRAGGTAAAFMMLAVPAAAQPSFNVSIGRAFNSFSEGSAAESRQSTAAQVELEHRAAGQRLRLFYTLDGGSFTTPGDWTYYLHHAGATWRFGPAQEAGKPPVFAVFAGGTLSWRSNGTSWSAADYRALGLFANIQRHPSPTSTLRAGYRFDLRDFSDFSQLDQQEHDAFASALVSFPSRTTLIGEVHVGAKNYRGGLVTVDVPMTTPVETTSAGGRGRMGMGMGPGLRWTPTYTERSLGALSGQVMILGRIAQSFADRTGGTLQFVRRSTFGDLPTAIVSTPALFFEDGVYDDPFASQANVLRATLKHVRPGGLEVEAQGIWMGKDYRGTRALDLEGVELASGELREDRIWRAGGGISVPLFGSQTGPVELSLDGDYAYTRHRSNDLFYNYRSHSVGVGFTVSY